MIETKPPFQIIVIPALMGLIVGYFAGSSRVDACTKELKQCNIKLKIEQEKNKVSDEKIKKCESREGEELRPFL